MSEDLPKQRRRSPLSASVRRRVLANLLVRAEAGDVAAAEALARLSLQAAAAAARGSCTCARRIAAGWGSGSDNAPGESK